MISVSSAILYTLTFFSVYFQVFLLFTFLENTKKLATRKGETVLEKYPTVTIIVPCWNEENTIFGTVDSLLGLNYPKDKLKILLIDDGSTDNTWNVIQEFATFPQIEIFHQENGGKYKALNFGLTHTTSEFVGCLDADSVADGESLIRIMSTFAADPHTMAVAPSVVAHNTKTIIQNAQRAEYYMSVYNKKMLGILGGIHVTPGPLTIFRKKVFDDLGPYRHAHNTEDMEIAYRMQINHYKIEHCHDAYVYTNTPPTAMKLYRQRLRWLYGFINNTIDYKHVILKRKYGNFSLFTVPGAIMSLLTASYFLGRIIYNIGNLIYTKFVQYQTVGFNISHKLFSFDLFFINTRAMLFLGVLIYSFVLLSILLGRYMAEGKWRMSPDLLLFFAVFTVVGPFWLMRALLNTAFSRKPAWR